MNMHMYVSMHVCMYVCCMYVCMYACMHVGITVNIKRCDSVDIKTYHYQCVYVYIYRESARTRPHWDSLKHGYRFQVRLNYSLCYPNRFYSN